MLSGFSCAQFVIQSLSGPDCARSVPMCQGLVVPTFCVKFSLGVIVPIVYVCLFGVQLLV